MSVIQEKETFEVSSISEYISVITLIVNRNEEKIYSSIRRRDDNDTISKAIWMDKMEHRANQRSMHKKLYYRGQFSVDYSLLPSVFRSRNFFEKEDYFYHEMLVRNPQQFHGMTHLDRLVTMQHYDCPTRLLDLSSNPLVSLFFACMNYSNEKLDPNHRGAVFLFRADPEDILYFDSDRAMMLSCLASFSKTEKEQIWEIAKKQVDAGATYFNRPRDGSNRRGKYGDEVIEKLYTEITREAPSFERNMKPVDILKSYFIQPNKSNTRIVKQDGAFIISGLSRNDAEADDRIGEMIDACIIIRNQEQILKDLDALGINEASLFPEMDKVAHYLKTHCD